MRLRGGSRFPFDGHPSQRSDACAGEARRHAAIYAESANLGERERGSLAIVVTEMATNVVKHAGTGTIVVEAVTGNGSSGVRVLALDKGPGIRDLSGALRNRYQARTAGMALAR